MGEPRLFEMPHDRLHAHVHWSAEAGWTVWLSSWDEAEGSTYAVSEGYDRLTFAEALQALEDACLARLPFLSR